MFELELLQGKYLHHAQFNQTKLHTKAIQYKPARVSDALTAIAGPLAPTLACIDPFPHSRLLQLSRSYLHLIAVLAANPSPRIDLINAVMASNDVVDAIAITFGRPLPIKGILKKLPPTVLAPSEALAFKRICSCVRSRKLLSHKEAPSGLLIAILDRLPPDLRVRNITDSLSVVEEAAVISSVYYNEREDGRRKLASALATKNSRSEMFQRLRNHAYKVLGELPEGPKVRDPRMRQLRTASDMVAAGVKFRNCLATEVEEAINSERVYYTYEGEDHVVLALSPRVKGWSLDEARLRQNRRISNGVRQSIVSAFRKSGVDLVDEDGLHLKETFRAWSSLSSSGNKSIERVQKDCKVVLRYNSNSSANAPESDRV